MIVNINNF